MYDVMIIGGGSGGYAAAIRAAQLGANVILAECGETGGTCVNRGCIPSKVWLKAGDLYSQMKKADAFGINFSSEEIDLNTLKERKSGVSAEIQMGMEALMQNNGVEFIKGRAVIKSPREVDVDGQTIETKKIIVATGSSLEAPDIPGLDKAGMTTDDVLEMTEVPESILVCGFGYIEVEMAFLLNTFGCSVTMVGNAARILPGEDSETSQRIAQALREKGVQIIPKASVESVKTTKKGSVCVLSGAKEESVTVKKVLVSKRIPNTKDLGLEELGVKLNDDNGIQVNDRLESSVEGIFAIGDVTGGSMLSHTASSMAVFAAENAMGQDNCYPFHLIPRCLWTQPEMGSVGLSEDEAEEKGYDVETGAFPYAVNGLAMVRNQVDGAVKVVFDTKYGEILGVHIVGSNATEVIGEAVMAMQLECTVQELARSIRVHPTFSEAVVDAARDAGGWALFLPKG
ncbi:dihydrolipoyl dehydrogenase [Desulfotignum phosphitoxidans]|uniref:Dihydrolipoyl dehydrogenase n=1 Tax=Desulfotignum phosphitoxidans DSM 13687 TaxID=1286635 RepID=S0G846_9BACT|nr:dihydrolipoyl dehydrogenase [Desulfotignum phosphitoxidans]EMS81476.1 dihydrolipoyl dehydrogenase Lpd [Desulfotignum phosphitoxidans DSM 13687]